MHRRHILSVLLASLIPFAAEAGKVLTLDYADDGASEPFHTYLDASKFASATPEGRLIFDADANVMHFVSDETSSYQEMTSEEAQQLSDMMNQMLPMMKAQLDALPPEQREAQMAQLRKQMGGMLPFDTPTVTKTGEKKEISGWPCEEYEVSQSGEMIMRVWSTDPKNAGLTSEDLTPLRKFGEFFGEEGSMMSRMLGRVLRDFTEPPPEGVPPGLPVRIEQMGGAEAGRVVQILSVETQKIDPAVFSVPEGYEKKPMMQGGPGAGGGY